MHVARGQMENMVDLAAVRSVIRQIWPRRRRRCLPVHCHDFSSPIEAIFSAIRRSRALWFFVPLQIIDKYIQITCLVVVDGHETTYKLIRIALKERQALLRNGLTVTYAVQMERTCHPSGQKLSHAQHFMQDKTHAVF